MHFLTRSIVAAAVVALLVPLVALGGDKRGRDDDKDKQAKSRLIFATDDAGNLLRFREQSPELVRSKQITGLPMGVSLKGIDFRPATGDLYALGSDKVVYRVNPRTAIAVAEGPAFESMPTRSTATRSASTSTRPWTRSASRATRTTTSGSIPIRAACSRPTRS